MKIVTRYILLVCFGIITTINSLHGQTLSDCKEIVKKYYEKDFIGVQLPKGKRVYYYNLLFETEPDKPVAGYKNSAPIKMYISENQIHYLSEGVSTFQDKQDAIMVVNNPKMIIRSKSTAQDRNEKLLANFKIFSDSVFITSKVTDCQQGLNNKKEKLLYVTLQLGDKARDAMNVERILYQVNTHADKIEKITMYYVKGYKFKKTILTYVETDLNCKKDMTVPVKQLFFDTNGRLLKRYYSYKLVDNR